jgi:phosphatidate cytidylyltransferase
VIPFEHRGARASGNAASGAGQRRNLLLRIVSATVLAPVMLVSAYAGGWLFVVLWAVVAAGMLWEWTRLITAQTDARVLLPGLAALLAACAFTGLQQPGAAVGMIAVGAVLAGGVMVVWPHRYPEPTPTPVPTLWAMAGVVYAGIGFIGPALLRRDAEFGFLAIVFLAAIVWTTDIFAYFVGRAVGGPLLWPRVSPNKTWAGAFGGLAGGVVAGVCVAYASGLSRIAILGVIALLLSVLAQTGDLFESAIKRRFGVKDASQLIPGHGGLMDRLDGFLVAALAALVIGILRQGTAAPAHGLLIW